MILKRPKDCCHREPPFTIEPIGSRSVSSQQPMSAAAPCGRAVPICSLPEHGIQAVPECRSAPFAHLIS